MSYAASLGSFAVFVCGSFVFGFSSSSLRFSLFFVCDTTDRDDGDDDGDDDDGDDDDVDKTSVDNQLDTVDGVDGDIDNFDDKFCFLSFKTNDLPCLIFLGGVEDIAVACHGLM
jgi:hypothetical protein